MSVLCISFLTNIGHTHQPKYNCYKKMYMGDIYILIKNMVVLVFGQCCLKQKILKVRQTISQNYKFLYLSAKLCHHNCFYGSGLVEYVFRCQMFWHIFSSVFFLIIIEIKLHGFFGPILTIREPIDCVKLLIFSWPWFISSDYNLWQT